MKEKEKKQPTKKMIEVCVHDEQGKYPIPIDSNIMSKMQIGDRINAGYQEQEIFSDSETPAHYFFYIYRDRIETDDEFNKRIEQSKKDQQDLKERRYQTYLKLKKEFGNEES